VWICIWGYFQGQKGSFRTRVVTLLVVYAGKHFAEIRSLWRLVLRLGLLI